MDDFADRNAKAFAFVQAFSHILSRIRANKGRLYLTELEEELAFLKIYIATARDYYSCDLNIVTDLNEACLKRRIPVLSLQRLIETAIVCTKNRAVHERRVTARIFEKDAMLNIEINTFPLVFHNGRQELHILSPNQDSGSFNYSDNIGKPFIINEGPMLLTIPLFPGD